MTLYSETTKQSYNGDGVQTDFPVTIPFFAPQDLTVYLSDPVSGEESLLEAEVDYVLTGLLEGSATVSTLVAPPGGKRLTILRRSAIRQTLDYAENDAFPAASHERALDLAAARDQELAEELGRSLRVPPTDGGALLLPPAPQRAGKVLLFDEAGDVSVTPEAYSDQMAAMADHLAEATAAANAAEAARDQAQYFGQHLKGTSSSSVALGTGSKSFTTQDDRTWSVGQRLRAASPDASKVMDGEVLAYSGGLLTLSVDYSKGSGTHDDWLLSVVGARGPAGAGDGDLMAANNLSDLEDAAAARGNLGLGGLAVKDTAGNADLANMAQATVKGRAAGAGTGAPADLSAAQLAALLTGSAIDSRGKHTIAIPASAFTNDPDDPPEDTLVVVGINDNDRAIWPVKAFDPAVRERVWATVPLPKGWDPATNLGFRVVFHVDGSSSGGDVFWWGDFSAVGDGDADVGTRSSAFGGQTTAVPGGLKYSPTYQRAITGASKSDVLNLRLQRHTSSGSDTLPDDANLVAVIIDYTVNAPTDA